MTVIPESAVELMASALFDGSSSPIADAAVLINRLADDREFVRYIVDLHGTWNNTDQAQGLYAFPILESTDD